MSKLIKAESTLTQRYQTTIPYVVRQTLGLEKGNKISYQIQEDGSVIITRCQNNQEELDPILGQFLDFLEQDINKNPQQIKAMTSTEVNHLKSLVNHVAVDLETSLEDEEE
ncbi:type II toxin-antitoxin system PrlF family antitoxin [Geminocystis sp. CENA526]|uniref:type II toxin-antitoxin system PrlF family antitoxin n=1 Tax=Geminocystis sp. CENA526 TaxID=1355871 RepID=UPI003D6FCD21